LEVSTALHYITLHWTLSNTRRQKSTNSIIFLLIPKSYNTDDPPPSKHAAQYVKEDWQKDLLNKITSLLLTNINFLGVDFQDPSSEFEKPDTSTPPKQIRVLDYACGPGTITHALGTRATEYIGLDLSENMVEAYNMRFNPDPSAQPTENTAGMFINDKADSLINAHAIVGNLLGPEGTPAHLDDEKYNNFDLVAVGMGFHHFQNLPLCTARLVERLKPGGVLMIVDFVTHAMESAAKENPALSTIAHHGFSEQELKGIFEGAGLEDFGIVRLGEKVEMRGIEPREPFVARARKPMVVSSSL
jgi:SAM-dependent methyltransferase